MNATALTRVVEIGKLEGAGPFSVSADGVDIALVKDEGRWRAFQGRCPHMGALLGEGELENGQLVCRNHRWRFSVRTGRRDGGPECLASCPVTERDGVIHVDVSGVRGPALANGAKRHLDDLAGPKGLPFVGNLHQLDPAAVHTILEGWQTKYGPVFGLKLGPVRALAISEPAMVDQVLRARPDVFRRQSKMDQVLKEIGVTGVFNAEGDVWRPQRKLAVAALSQRHLRLLYPHISTVARRLHGRWRKLAAAGETLDVVQELKRFTVDVTMLVAFGHDVNTVEQDDDVIQKHLELIFPKITQRIFAVVPSWRFLKLPSDRRLERSLSEVRSWLSELLVAATRREGTSETRNPSTFLDAMATAVDDHGRKFSDDVIMSNLLTMVLAGEDTTAFTLAWAIHELADHPHWAEQIRLEADGVLGHDDTARDLDAANRAQVANAVANETMRLRPVAPVGLFEANFDTTIGDIQVPAGATVIVLSRPAALEEEHFADPRAFRPDRWLKTLNGAHDLNAHIPFGSGPRMCPGRSLALIEMNTLLSMLYKNFSVERVGTSENVKEQFGFTMSPVGLEVRLRSRACA